MEIEYEQTREDLNAFQRHFRKHGLKRQRNSLLSTVIWIGVFGGVYLLVDLKDMVQIPLPR